MFCSTIIPTIGRETLTRAVQSVLDQKFVADDFEVIVVNDSGRPLPDASWQRSDRVRIISTQQRERSVARNTGAAIARGRHLHFLDDDDWVLPGALESFWALAQVSNASWLYGGARLVDGQGADVGRMHLGISGNCFCHAMVGEWIPTGAYLIKSEMFFAVGGFDSLVVFGQDTNICQRVLRRANAACTDADVVVITRDVKSTSDRQRGLQLGRWAREKILSESGVFGRMRESASSSYWYGRIVRLYLFSVVWNLRRFRTMTAVSRAIFATAAFALAGPYLLSPGFWSAATHGHTSGLVH